MASLRPTSFRFDDEFLDLLDAWAEALGEGRYRQTHRADVIFHAIKTLDINKAPSGPTKRLVDAYAARFGAKT